MFRSLRILQIRVTSRLLEVWGRTPVGCTAIRNLRKWKLIHRFARFLVGYRRTFASFSEAERYASKFLGAGHEHPDNIADHCRLADEGPRESDYPVLFFLAPLTRDLQRVFDLGGSVGNLFYELRGDLDFRNDLVWTVYDLPSARAAGVELARAKAESRLHFTDSFNVASGCDLFIVSGALHYFEAPIAEMLASLDRLPRYLIINRTPCLRDASESTNDLITVHDHGGYLLPTKLHSTEKLVRSLRALGYTLRARWPVHERHQWIPLYPDLSSTHYSGFYFVRGDVQDCTNGTTPFVR